MKSNASRSSRFSSLAYQKTHPDRQWPQLLASWGRLSKAFKAGCALAALSLAGGALADPFTLYFEGKLLTHHSYFTRTNTSFANENEMFSGYITWDIDPAERSEVDIGSDGFAHAWAISNSGCSLIVDGVCSGIDYGTDVPVVLDYLFTWSGGAARSLAWDPSSSIYDSSERRNIRYGPPVYLDREDWLLTRTQSQEIRSDVDGGFDQTYLGQTLAFFPFAQATEVVFGSLSDLNVAPMLTAIPATQRNVFFEFASYLRTCRTAEPCTINHDPDAYYVYGTLTSVNLVRGTANVPLPGTLALLGIGLVGIAGLRASLAG